MWSQLGSRPIEALLDLPLMSRPGRVRDDGRPRRGHASAAFTDVNLRGLVIGSR